MTRRKVRWAKSARRDLELIVAYLADHAPQAALAQLVRIETRAKSLSTFAERGRIVPELGRLHIQQYRELVIPPYRLVYRIHAPQVLVLVFWDARRNLEDALLDRLIRIEGQEQ